MDTKRNQGPIVGVFLGFLFFIATGAIPALLYGGYLAVLVSTLLFGETTAPSEASRYLILGGMATGFAAVCALYLVAGAFLGGLAEGAWSTVNRSKNASGGNPPPAGR